MVYHRLYGLLVRSDCRLPGLTVVEPVGSPDVAVTIGRLPQWISEASDQTLVFPSQSREQQQRPSLMLWRYTESNAFRFLYEDGVEFIIDGSGRHIAAIWPESSTLEDMAIYLVGPILGFVLRLRGELCLHASGVVVNDRAIAVMGPAGAGKSTTAAGFADAGYAVVSDDILPILSRNQEFLVQPGYPQLRLWPESVRALFGTADALPRITPTWEKCHLDLTTQHYRFQNDAIPLAAVYLLDERTSDPSAPRVESMTPREIFMALIANTYANYLLDAGMRAREFSQLQHLVSIVPVRRVRPHSDPALLAELCKVIADDAQGFLNCLSRSLSTDHSSSERFYARN